MSFKRGSMDEDGGADNDSQPFKRQRFDNDNGGFRGRGRGRGDRGSRGRGGGGFRGRGDGFRSLGDGFRSRGDGFRGRGRGGFNRDDNGGFRGRGRGRGFGGDRGRGDRGRGGGGGFRGRGGFGGDNRGNAPVKESIIKLNQVAPSFDNLSNQDSESVSLKQFRGKYVVLFIYYQNGSFGCSKEQQAFRDLKEKFDKHNAVIIGLSRDDPASHQSAVEENKLNYTLLTDTEGKITKVYGSLDDNDRVTRSTFIISPEGKVAALWAQVYGFERHPQEVLAKLEEITGGGSKNDDDDDNNEDNAEEEENEAEDNEDGDDQEEDDDDE